MQSLTLKEIATAAMAAYEARTLTAQAEDPANARCLYALDCQESTGKITRKCAIGASFNGETFLALQQPTTDHTLNHVANISTLVDRGIVRVDYREDARDLQGAHDRWCDARRDGMEDDIAPLESEFVNLLTEILS